VWHRRRETIGGSGFGGGLRMTTGDVRAYYDRFGEREWARLENPADGAVEFAVTCHALAAHLPAGARVLDLGGGPGRYTRWLAERGHRVVLADLSPVLLEVARAKLAHSAARDRVEAIVEADARDLSRWPDGSFDAAVALGPFYHLPDPADRDRAAGEVARVLRPGGVAFVALMPRYAFLRRTLALPDERHRLADPAFVARVLEEGVFVNDVPGRFTGACGVRPAEVAPFFEEHGFVTRALLACEGIVADLQPALAEAMATDPAVARTALDLVLATAADPSILGMSAHLLYVGTRINNGGAHASLEPITALPRPNAH
jgi:SAM-dependent methyltransferase